MHPHTSRLVRAAEPPIHWAARHSAEWLDVGEWDLGTGLRMDAFLATSPMRAADARHLMRSGAASDAGVGHAAGGGQPLRDGGGRGAAAGLPPADHPGPAQQQVRQRGGPRPAAAGELGRAQSCGACMTPSDLPAG